MITTKIYKNTGKQDVFVVGVGDIPAGEQVSITTEYHQPIVISNYPTLVEVTADDYVDDQTNNDITAAVANDEPEISEGAIDE